jgi:GT2 family glycosyltransferase/SAM-dependent methyltransferase/peptidoglycan hydrolase CwlO-like protein
MLEWTGEKCVPGMGGAQIQYEHLHRYAYARQFVRDKKVIDLACGEGYGSDLLAGEASYVLGIDIDQPTIAHAASRYKRDNLEFTIGSIIDIPVKGRGKFDVAVCFEAIEHITKHKKLLSEVKRVLRVDGLLIISTPNKTVYTDAPDYHNPFHLKELYLDQFEALLRQYFENVQVLGQRVYAGSDIWDIGPRKPRSVMEVVVKEADGELHFTGKESKEPVYFVALASNFDLNKTHFSAYSRLTDVSASINSGYETQIAGLNSEIQSRDGQLTELNTTLQTRDSQINELNNAVKSRDALTSELSSAVQARDGRVAELNAVVQARDGQIGELNAVVQARDGRVAELNAVVQARDGQIGELNAVVQARDGQIGELNAVVQARVGRVAELNAVVQARDAQLAELNATLQTRDRQIGELNAVVQARDSQIGELNAVVQARDAQLANIQAQMLQINQGIVVQIMSRFRNIIDKLLRKGTKPRNYYELGLTGLRIILNDGWGAFYKRYKSWASPQKLNPLSISSQEIDQYQLWISKNEPDISEIQRQRSRSSSFKYRPKISIITPVWNPKAEWLQAAIESVLNQTYDNWELCLADGRSTKPHVRRMLKEYARKDSRIKVTLLPKNKGISGNSNEALALAKGEFIALLDHDDELAAFALYEIAQILNDNTKLDFIYSDEDIIDETGQRLYPSFKPDWSPDLLLSYMYTCHLSIFRKKLVEESGGFRPEYDGSQDHDLVLRLIERTKNIYHIPKILYHWRVTSQSAAGGHSEVKPYAHIAGKKAIKDYLQRNSIEGDVIDGAGPGLYSVRRKINDYPAVTIIIPTKDNHRLIQNCINSILHKTSYDNYEIIIVNNQSRESEVLDYLSQLKKHPKITILEYNKPFNFSAINNLAVSQSKGEHILFLNNDTEVINEDWLTAMLEHSQRTEVGAVGAKLLFPDNRIQHCGVILGIAGVAGHAYYGSSFPLGRPSVIGNYSAVTAACMMLRKEVFAKIGGFDENLAVLYNDVDLCLKIRQQNYLIVYTPYATLYHHESATKFDTKPHDPYPHDTNYFKNKWDRILRKGDPYYNPNLTLDKSDFSFRI